MSKSVLITGTSSGIGKATVKKFSEAGWKVAATMRTPAKGKDFERLRGVKVFALDVTNPDSIKKAFADTVDEFGRLDAVVNNAGYGVDGVFEAMDDDVIRRQFDTNVFGLMRVTREAIPLMRRQGGGTIVQIASMGGRLAFPLYSIYHGTKWAVEGFTEALHYEVKDFGIRLKIIEPGAIKTEFYGSSREFIEPGNTEVYRDFVKKVEKVSQETGAEGKDPGVVAKTIVEAARDSSSKMRYPVGSPAPMLLMLRRILPERLFFRLVRSSYKI